MSIQPEISDSGASAGALVFLRGEKDADFAEINSRLLREDGVAASVPLFGDWNILLRLAAKNQESLKQIVEKRIRSLNGVEDFEAHYLEEVWTANGGGDQKAGVRACAVLDVDSGSLATIVARLRAMAGIVEGNITDGGKKIILFLRGNSSREIRNVLGSEVRPLSGVLRVKLINAMNF